MPIAAPDAAASIVAVEQSTDTTQGAPTAAGVENQVALPGKGKIAAGDARAPEALADDTADVDAAETTVRGPVFLRVTNGDQVPPSATPKAQGQPDASLASSTAATKSAPGQPAPADAAPAVAAAADHTGHQVAAATIGPKIQRHNSSGSVAEIPEASGEGRRVAAIATTGGADLPQPGTFPASQLVTAPPALTGTAATSPNTAASYAPAVPLSGLALEIVAQARDGRNRFEIRLDPPELGRIDVHLQVDRDGNVSSHLFVERTDTLDLLRRDAPTLERALHNAGLKTADQGLEFSLRDQGLAREHGNREESSPRRVIVVDPAPLAPTGYGRSLNIGAGIDIRV
jgi:flagellar hook-length control protein FliK